MKKQIQFLAIALLAAALCTQCKNNPSPATTDGTASNGAAAEGYWVNKAWWEVLQSTKSPHEASKHLGVAGVAVDQDSAGAWTAVVNYAFHEGMIYKLKAADGPNFTLVNTEDSTVAHQFKFNADKTVFLDSFEMLRIGDAKMKEADYSGQLLGGTYALKGGKADVVFGKDGSLTGLPGYAGYEVLYDYIEDQLAADELMLIKSNTDGERDFYVFQAKGNQLLLSTIEETMDKDSITVYKTGKVKYELTRK